MDECTLWFLCCFKKANLPNYDYLDICLNFISHEGNTIRDSQPPVFFSCSCETPCPWQCIPLEMKGSRRFVAVRSEACLYLLYLDSLEIKGLHVQQNMAKKRLPHFECTQNEHMWENKEWEDFLTLLGTSKDSFKYHTHCSQFHLLLKKSESEFAVS